jgi:hypothetical protein
MCYFSSKDINASLQCGNYHSYFTCEKLRERERGIVSCIKADTHTCKKHVIVVGFEFKCLVPQFGSVLVSIKPKTVSEPPGGQVKLPICWV